ncbi:MFS transporter [Micromonospora sp. RP3T]|uniref:MFS transporter n=1 Tax=Micromonospora sp. RP3T TaxID=2135446 RepID=UPI003D729D8C
MTLLPDTGSVTRREHHLRRVRTGFVLSQVFFGLATSLFDMYYALFLGQVGIPPAGAGQVFSVGFTVMAVIVLPLSAFTDRLGLEPMMLLSSFGFAGTMLAIPFVDSLSAHLLLFGLNSVCSALMLVSVNAVLASAIHDEQERFALFRTGFVAFLTASAVGNVAGVLLARVGAETAGWYRFDLLCSAVLAVLIGVARIAMWRRDAAPAVVPGEPRPPVLPALRANAGHLAGLFVLAVLVGGAGVLAIRFINLVAVNYLHLATESLGWLLVADRLASVLGIFVLFPLMKRGGALRVAGLAMIAALFLQILSATAGTASLFVLWYLLRQGAHYAQMPVLDNLANSRAAQGTRAFVNGVQRMGIFAGSAAASLAYGSLMSAGRYRGAVVLSGVLSLLAGVTYLVQSHVGLRRRGADQ